MLEFDFRNGPLRRKYDGLKYALKAIEDVTYELSLQDPISNKSEDEPLSKRLRASSISGDASGGGSTFYSLLDSTEFDQIRHRMEAYDKSREVHELCGPLHLLLISIHHKGSNKDKPRRSKAVKTCNLCRHSGTNGRCEEETR